MLFTFVAAGSPFCPAVLLIFALTTISVGLDVRSNLITPSFYDLLTNDRTFGSSYIYSFVSLR